MGFSFLPCVREQQVIGLQVSNRLVSTYCMNPSVFGTSRRACCDTLLFLDMLQCSSHQQLTDIPTIFFCTSMIPLGFSRVWVSKLSVHSRDVYLPLPSPLFASFAFQWSYCHCLGPCLGPLSVLATAQDTHHMCNKMLLLRSVSGTLCIEQSGNCRPN